MTNGKLWKMARQYSDIVMCMEKIHIICYINICIIYIYIYICIIYIEFIS